MLNEPASNSSWNTRPQSSQFAEPLRTDPGLKSWNWSTQTANESLKLPAKSSLAKKKGHRKKASHVTQSFSRQNKTRDL